MKQIIYRLSRWGVLLPVLLLIQLAMPLSAATQAAIRANSAPATSINATVYLPMGALQPLFQQQIDQQVPTAVNGAIGSMVNKLPSGDRGWATQMASALLQPSATLVSLKPQQDGLAATIRISLYPGDPSPTNASLLVTMSVRDSATVQVSARPLPGNPTLVNGPLTTIQVPLGQLNSINATPSCGDAALAVHVQVPMSLSGQASMQGQTSTTMALSTMQEGTMIRAAQTSTPSYVEIPSSSLSSMGSSIGTLSLGNNITARNIQVSVQSGQLITTSDITLGSSLVLGKATSNMQPVATQGKLTVNVLKTTMTVFSLFTFPDNTYNQQIELSLNTKLSNALGGKFYVNSAAIGSNSHVSCAAADSLILTGSTNLG
jgi:hypothetical protein